MNTRKPINVIRAINSCGQLSPALERDVKLDYVLEWRVLIADDERELFERFCSLRKSAVFNTKFHRVFMDGLEAGLMSKTNRHGFYRFKQIVRPVFLAIRDVPPRRRFSEKFGLPQEYVDFEKDLLKAGALGGLSYLSDPDVTCSESSDEN